LDELKIQNSREHHYTKRLINEITISDFKLNLSYLSWDEIFTEDSVDSLFNSFLNTYLRIFYHSFPFKKCHPIQVKKAWITTGIKTSCQHKRDLYLLCRGTKIPKFSSYYKTYCKILTEVIKTAKELHYNKLITNSNNRVKTTWNIVKTETQKIRNDEIPPMNVDGSVVEDHQTIANIYSILISQQSLIKWVQINWLI